ncbi:MAG: mycothiol system anti-sigma-R factor [Actinobacteria bacterium]|nr:MAG: mycothiol system anti-sigma-R factor [Actinomycetota bacterium]
MTNNEDCVDVGAGNCDDALARLYEYLDNEMDDATAEGIRSHLDGCGGCHDRFDVERRLKVVVKQRLEEDVPQQFIAKLRHALEEEAARH